MASATAGDRGDPSTRDDSDLLAALRTGDEAAFTLLVERYHIVMVRLARAYVRDTGLAKEVAQDAWLSILRGLDGFEARSSLKTLDLPHRDQPGACPSESRAARHPFL
jgi:RNA polymerase sigma-70 factor (ECF subfamily)